MNYYVHMSSDGTPVRATYPGDGAVPTVQFGSDDPIALPGFCLSLDVCRQDADGDVWAVGILHDTDRGILISQKNRAIRALDIVHGPGNIRVERDGSVSWVRQGGAWLDYMDGRKASEPVDARHPLAPDLAVRETWNGTIVVPLGTAGVWELADDGTAPDGQTRLLARFGSSFYTVFEGYTPVPAKLVALSDGSVVVCISLPKDERTFFVSSFDFKPYVQPVISIPTFQPHPHRTALVIDGEPGVPWFADTSPQWRDGELGVLWDNRDQYQLDEYEALALGTKRVLYRYADKLTPTADDFRQRVTAASLPMAQCYPFRGETDSAYQARVLGTVRLMESLGPYALYVCGFLGTGTAGARTLQQVLSGLAIVARAIQQSPRCRLVAVFTWVRGSNDGVVHLPEVAEAVRRWQAAMHHPADYPTVAELKPAVPSAPKPPPVTPEPVVPKLTLPSYDRFVNQEAQQVTAAFKARHGHDPSVSDQMHFFWRRLVEGWTHEQVLADIRGEAVNVDVLAPTTGLPSYAQFIDQEAHEIQAEYLRLHGNMPAASDMAHNAWRRLVERWPYRSILAGLGGADRPADPHGTPSAPAGPSPTTRPEAVITGVGASEYGLLTNTTIDRVGFAQALIELEMRHTRVGLMNAWSWRQHPSYPGTVDGLIPIRRPALDAAWDLDAWNEQYFVELRALVDLLNSYGVLPVFTAWELYSWNTERKPAPVGQHLLPFQHNVNGFVWRDDNALYTIATPGDWMDRFLGKFAAAVSGTACGVETANEMPEKALHARIFDSLRRHGFTGPIQCNRHEDKPSQYANMISGVEPHIIDTRAYDAIAFHGRARMSDLDEHNDEPKQRPTTFRKMFEHAYDGPKYDFSKIVFSSDGCRQSGRPIEQTYDWDALAEVAEYVLGHGSAFEHQLTTKMRWFYDGRIDVADVLNIDGPFLRRVAQ